MEIKEKKFNVIIKTNANKNEILGYDTEKQAYRIAIKERAEKGKANLELIKFLEKILRKKVKICCGLKSKYKIIEVI